jgi:LuxR family maltose regulon positive regulatory protein
MKSLYVNPFVRPNGGLVRAGSRSSGQVTDIRDHPAFPRLTAVTETMQLIQDKITVPDGDHYISRVRLLEKLKESLSACSATIITGRAGTGKTSLALAFTKVSGRRCAWFKVDASDADLHVFFDYMVASVAEHRPGFGSSLLRDLVRNASQEDLPLLAETFVFELLQCSGEPLLIVIDDLHLVYDAGWVIPFFGRMLPLLPHDVHVLVSGRSMPPAPLWRMRSKQTLCVIDEDNLAFTYLETKRLFKRYGLSAAHARIALEETRGRVRALKVVARALCETLVGGPKSVPTGSDVGTDPAQVQHIHGYPV